MVCASGSLGKWSVSVQRRGWGRAHVASWKMESRQGNQLPTNLPQLQNLIKRDSSAYRDEFLQQYRHYQALLQLFLLNPSQESKKLEELVMFLSQVCSCYRDDMEQFPDELMSLLQQHGPILEPEIRLTLCRSLILMRNRNIIQPRGLLELFFELFRCQDKILRKALYTHIISDIKRINSKRKNNKVNLSLQNFMFTMLKDSSVIASRMSLEVMVQLYKKNIWNDAKTVNVIATACFSPVTKVMACALKFFLSDLSEEQGEDKQGSDNESSEDEAHALRNYMVTKQTSKKGRKRERKMAKALSTIKQKQKKKRKSQGSAPVFSALYLINDPQDFSERLFKKLKESKANFEVRLMMMSLISRLTGLHQLFLLNFYPFLNGYLKPHQLEVTKVLTYLAQACHELVPPEVIEPSVRAIANNFITERNSSEVMAIGLNAVREMCVRCPLVMTAELLQDLASYKSYRDKSVMMAARSLIHLYRDANPELLKKKDRGKPVEGSRSVAVKAYGQLDAVELPSESELTDTPAEDSDAVEEDKAGGRRGKKRQLLEMLGEQEERRREGQGGLLPEAAIVMVDHAKKRRRKEDRIATVMDGREKREKFGSKRRKLNPDSSSTNKQKAKKKAFSMIKHKRAVKGKNRKSFREKQMALRKSLLKQKKRK